MTSWIPRIGRGKVNILSFHRLPKEAERRDPQEFSFEQFQQLVDELRADYTFLSLVEAVDQLRAGILVEPALVLTFDDGYASWAEYVAPWLHELRVRGTFLVTTGQLRGEALWNERIEHAIHQLPEHQRRLDDLPGMAVPLDVGHAEARTEAVRRLTAALKYLSPSAREAALQALEGRAGVQTALEPGFDVQALRRLHAMGMEIGAHSISHPILSCCTEERAELEIVQARADLEALLGPLRLPFAYPNGEPGKDYTPWHVEMVRRAGYACAVSTHKGAVASTSDFLQLRRFTPWGQTPWQRRQQLLRVLSGGGADAPPRAAQPHAALMVAFHFPPQAGSSGVLRTLNFVRALPNAGWDVTLLTAAARAYERTSTDLMAEVQPVVQVRRAAAWDARRHWSIRGRYPELLALPDRWSSWWFDGVRQGLGLLRRGNVRLIWSTYPILSAHLIAGILARLSGLPWIAEFRDPVYQDGWPMSRIKRWLLPRLERWVVGRATCCVVTTEGTRQLFEQRYPASRGRVHVIENGYDEAAFEQAGACRPATPPERMLLLHSGAIYPRERDPGALFSALRRLCDSRRIDAKRVCLRFRGSGSDDVIRALARQHGVDDIVDLAPPLPYGKALGEMLAADLLLVIQGTAFNQQIPAKIYEYLRAQRPILALADLAGVTARRLADFDGVESVMQDDSTAIEEAISRAWKAFNADPQAYRLPARALDSVSPTSRQHGSQRFAALMAACAARSEATPLRG